MSKIQETRHIPVLNPAHTQYALGPERINHMDICLNFDIITSIASSPTDARCMQIMNTLYPYLISPSQTFSLWKATVNTSHNHLASVRPLQHGPTFTLYFTNKFPSIFLYDHWQCYVDVCNHPNTAFVASSLLLPFLTRKPSDAPRTFPYTTFLHTIPLFVILTFTSAVVSYAHVLLLRVFVKLAAFLVSIPFLTLTFCLPLVGYASCSSSGFE
jgi:hypothetical protein